MLCNSLLYSNTCTVINQNHIPEVTVQYLEKGELENVREFYLSKYFDFPPAAANKLGQTSILLVFHCRLNYKKLFKKLVNMQQSPSDLVIYIFSRTIQFLNKEYSPVVIRMSPW